MGVYTRQRHYTDFVFQLDKICRRERLKTEWSEPGLKHPDIQSLLWFIIQKRSILHFKQHRFSSHSLCFASLCPWLSPSMHSQFSCRAFALNLYFHTLSQNNCHHFNIFSNLTIRRHSATISRHWLTLDKTDLDVWNQWISPMKQSGDCWPSEISSSSTWFKD